jgi:phosphate transport system substrate-binding protein
MALPEIFLHGQKTAGLKITSREDMANGLSTKSQTPNNKQFTMFKISNSKQNCFGHWNLGLGYYLGFGIWRLGFLLFLLVISMAGGCQRSKAGITVAGSTSVEPFAELLAEEYMMHHPHSHIYVQGGGSTAGIEAVRSHAAHIGMSSRSLMGTEKSLYAVTIAKDAIAIIVNPKNPVEGLSLVRVRDVFSGKIRNWKELGGHDHPIILVTREEGSGTREAFQKLVMGEEEISLEALVQDSNGAIRQVVAGDPNAVGYISLGLVNEKVRALKISGAEPSVKNIESARYHLVRPFLFVFNGEPTGEAKAFLNFVMSPEAQRLLSKEGLVSILSKSSGG